MVRRARLSPLTPPEVILKRSLNERLDKLFEEANIRRFDPDFMDRAGALLETPDDDSCDHDNNDVTKTRISNHEYCRNKADFLLDLCNEDSDDENLNTSKKWLRKADMLLDLADESQPEKASLALKHVPKHHL